jgi:two-component system LytT family sensor kinase
MKELRPEMARTFPYGFGVATMSGETPRWFKIWVLWTIYGLLTAVQTHYRYAVIDRPFSWWQAILAEVSFAWIWALVTPFVLWMAERFPIGRSRWWLNCSAHLACAVVLGILTKAVWDATIYPIVHPERPAIEDWGKALQMSLLSLDYGVLQYGIVLLAQLSSTYFRRSEKDRLRASRLEAELARAQLQALKMQLHPHFLFNTLNAISELVHEDPDTAERMVIRLSDFLRLTLDHLGIPEVPLMMEIDFLKRYLEIEKMRFEDRLEVEFDVQPAALHGRVPNLILQPIVENALKHGLSKISGVGRLRIRANSVGGKLFLRVADNGPGISNNGRPKLREGIGLSNTRRRLDQAYGKDHIFSISNAEGGGCQVTIELPMRLSA